MFAVDFLHENIDTVELDSNYPYDYKNNGYEELFNSSQYPTSKLESSNYLKPF